MIARKIRTALEEPAGTATVTEVRIGLGYTGIRLDDGRAGLAYTFRDRAQPGCNAFDAERPLAGRPAIDILAMLESEDAIAAGIALACANALANGTRTDALDGDILTHLDLQPNDHVGMVGQFRPLLAPLRARARALTVFERIAEPQGDLRPAHEAAETLQECQVALITATSIINHTIDDLLDAAKRCRLVVVLGASTPLLPEVFAGTPVTMLSGVVVTQPAEALRVVSEGGGMRTFRRHCDKVCIRRQSTAGS